MYVDLQFPPGLSYGGTKRQDRGRWRDANLVRFYEGDIVPVGGWYQYSKTPVTGKGRELIAWSTNDNSLYGAIGTESALYVMTKGGTIHEITPAGLVAGQPIATTGGGYGEGAYGEGAYGAPIQSDANIIPASVWSLDTWGENLVGVLGPNMVPVEWVPDVAFNAAQPIANAPTCNAILTTPEDILVAFGADNDPRLLKWCDVRDNTDWTPTATNRAGDIRVPSAGRLLSGVSLDRGFLAFTNTDVWLATYLGAAGYSIRRVADGAGAISQNSVVRTGDHVFWMGREGFWGYAGRHFPLSCDVSDRVFPELNRSQASLVTSFHNSAFKEVWWLYPDEMAEENTRYVCYNYQEGHWSHGDLSRLSCVDRGSFDRPLMVAPDGHIYAHESGVSHDGAQAFLEGGPLSLGENTADILAVIPDGETVSDATLTLTGRYYPHGQEATQSEITMSERTNVRMNAREIDVRFEFRPDNAFRVGIPTLEVTPRGRR